MSILNEELPSPRVMPAQDPGRRSLKLEPVRGTVLIVEDDPAHRELLVELLTQWGYEPLPVGSAEEAEFAVRNKRMDAAIVDVFLPGPQRRHAHGPLAREVPPGRPHRRERHE